MRHLSLASSFILLTLLGALGLGTEVSGLAYPLGFPTGEIEGGTYRMYFDNIFPGCTAGQVIQSFSAVGVPVCVTPTATGFSIPGAALGHTLYYNGSTWVSSTNIYNSGGNVGIGTSTPGAKLEIAGQVKITGGTPGAGKILTSDAAGLAVWAAASASNQVCPGTGSGNTCYGIGVGNSMTTGYSNTANGFNAFYFNTTGYNNTANGVNSLYSNTTGYSNTAFGVTSLYSNTSGYTNTAIGRRALYSNTLGYQNTAIGQNVLGANITGNSNAAVGHYALASNITGNNNSVLGIQAGQNLTSGDNNIFLGYNVQPNISTTASNQLNIGNWIYGNSGSIGIGVLNPTAKLEVAGQVKITGGTPGAGKVLTSDATGLATWSTAGTQVCPGTGTGNTCYGIGAGSGLTTGAYNTVNGYNSLFSNTIGNYNTANGYQTLFSNTTGVHNIAYGAAALYSNTTGFRNVAVGTNALRMNISGNKNVAVGVLSLYGNTTGSGNTALGDFAGSGLTSGDNNIFLGYNVQPNISTTASNQLNIGNWIYGNGGNIGIGVLNPGAKLEVAGQVKITGGTPGAGKVLTSDATGLATWVTPGAASNQVCPGTGTGNTCYGIGAGNSMTTGNGNTANGYLALNSNTTGNINAAFGRYTLQDNTTGVANTAYGPLALNNNITGINNTADGVSALVFNITGNNNIGLGWGAGSNLTSGDNNIFIGSNAQPNISTTASNQLNIGNWLYGNGGNIGIGVLNPGAKLEVAGQVKITGGTPGLGKILMSDATGLATWANPGNQVCPGTGINNTCYGVGALSGNTTGYNNVANGYRALYSNTTGYDNTAVGLQSLASNTTGYDNTAVGFQSLTSNTTGFQNTANGSNALRNNISGSYNTANGINTLFANTTGNSNTAIGQSVLTSNTTGYDNTAIGLSALYTNTSGYNNTANGVGALYYNSTGSANTANGVNVLRSNTIGYNNTAMGLNALYANTTGYQNTAVGQSALYANTTGYQNVANGVQALFSNTTGNSNTANGVNALYTNTTGNNNLALGRNAGSNLVSGDNNIFIGFNAQPNISTGSSNQLNIGNWLYGNGGNIGIGVLNPGAKLEVAGQVKITGGTPGLGKILMSDATGLATWTNSISGATATGITGGSGNYIPKFGTGGTGLYSSVIYQNGTNIAIGTGTATAKLTLDSGVVNTAGLRLTRLTTTSPTYTGAVVGLGIDASGNVVPVSNGDVVVYDGIGRNGTTPSPNPNIANRAISYDFNRYFLIPTKQSFVVSDGNGAGYNAPYFKEDGVSGLCSWNGASGTSPYDCATADPYTGLSASPNNSFTMTARGTSYGYQIALGARGDAPLFARSGKWYNATSNYGSGLYLADGTTPTPWQKVLTVPANHIEYFYVNIGYNSQLQAISGGGNIGMGTSTPDMRLVLAYSGSTGSTSEMMRIERGPKGADANMVTTFGTPYILIGGKETRTNSIQTIGFGYNSASSYQPAEIGLVTTNTAGNTQGDLVFATRSGTTNTVPTERMRIFGNGSVGIGTTTIASRFEVWSGATTIFHMRGTNNIGMGIGSVRSLLSGNANTGFGNESLYTLTTGYSNSAFGHQALRQSTTGYNNSAFGKEAMYNNGDGTWNTALGYQALRSGTSTDYNVAIGGQTLYTLGTGTGNVAIGHNALYGATTSTSNNIAIGYMAGSGITTGWNNIVIGNAAQARTSTGSNQLNIGNWIYGNGGNIGVGSPNPTAKLEVSGAIRAADNAYVGGTPFIYVGDDAYLSDVDVVNTISVQGVQNSAVGAIRLGSNAASTIYGNGGNIGVGTSTPGAKLDVNGTFKLGAAGTATTAAGTCTIASVAITTTASTYTCTGVPASTAVALHCNGTAAFTTPGTTSLYCRANGFVNSVTCNTTTANTNAMTYKCMWMQ